MLEEGGENGQLRTEPGLQTPPRGSKQQRAEVGQGRVNQVQRLRMGKPRAMRGRDWGQEAEWQ